MRNMIATFIVTSSIVLSACTSVHSNKNYLVASTEKVQPVIAAAPAETEVEPIAPAAEPTVAPTADPTVKPTVTIEEAIEEALEEPDVATIVVSLADQRVNVYGNDRYGKPTILLRSMICSTGREGHRTPTGTYSIYEHTDKGGMHLMVDGTYAKWCMRWKKGGYMFHTVCYAHKNDADPIPEEVEDLGTPVSRGCVRLTPEDAEWLYKNTANGATVITTELSLYDWRLANL